MSTQAASIILSASNTLLEWCRNAVGDLDAVTYFMFTAQEQVRMLLLGLAGFAFPSGASWDLGLLNGGTEITGNGYARVNWGFGASFWSNGTLAQYQNAGVINWPSATANWPAATALLVFDHSTGIQLCSGSLNSSVSVLSGNNLQLAIGAWILSVP